MDMYLRELRKLASSIWRNARILSSMCVCGRITRPHQKAFSHLIQDEFSDHEPLPTIRFTASDTQASIL